MSEMKKEIKISEVLDLLNQGKDRAGIREHYGLTHQEMQSLFQHPKLKNKKPKSQPSFILVDDTEGEVSHVVTKEDVAANEGENLTEGETVVIRPEEVAASTEVAPEWS